MIDTTAPHTGRALRDPVGAVVATRRLVGLERQYHCDSCGGERRSWTRLAACPDCGEAFVTAVIRRAAVAA